jgi:prepilin-type N-terminal cleavage/methylation domain-containing protein
MFPIEHMHKHLVSRRRRSGFTLPEVIVTITLIAILASVVVPTIVSQVKKGDPSRLGSDYLAVRGASEQFLSDLRRYPASVSQLTTVVTTSMAALPGTTTGNYGAAEVARWRGPYLSKDASAALSTGFGLSLTNTFEVDSLSQSGVTNSASGQKYMVLAVPSANDSVGIADFDRQFDDGVISTGSIRYDATAKKLYLLLMPIYSGSTPLCWFVCWYSVRSLRRTSNEEDRPSRLYAA